RVGQARLCRRGRGHHRRMCHGVGPAGAAAQLDAVVALGEVDLAEVVLAHQADEIADGPHVERPGVVDLFCHLALPCALAYTSPRSASSSLGTLVSTSQPPGVTSTSSSILTPPQPGR